MSVAVVGYWLLDVLAGPLPGLGFGLALGIFLSLSLGLGGLGRGRGLGLGFGLGPDLGPCLDLDPGVEKGRSQVEV